MVNETKQSRGGTARAKILTPRRKKEIAQKAADARWGTDLPLAIYDGILTVGEIQFDCAVLGNETRVVSETNFMESMGMYRSGALSTRRESGKSGARPPLHLAYKNLQPFVEKHFDDTSKIQLKYRTKSGGIGHGIRADALPKICEVWLDAQKAKVLGSTQEMIADRAGMLIRGFAHVGVVALVDEATGYQYARQRDALERMLEEFISEELRRWVKAFPSEYFRELCRLRSVVYRPDMRLPSYFGHLTNDIVYNRMHPTILKELKRKNTADEGKKKGRLHQWLTDDVGHPKLLQHLGMVIGFMRVCSTYDEFYRLLDRGAPVPNANPTLFDRLED